MDNQKNLLIAVVLSIVILVGFDFFFAPPKKELTESGVTNENVSENTFRTDVDDNIPSIKVTKFRKSTN